jgi:catechol-2,3-dioxygenase
MPTKMPDFKRSPHISLRLSPEEKALFREAVLADGKKSLGTWLKHLARQRVEELRRRGSLRSKEGGADNP